MKYRFFLAFAMFTVSMSACASIISQSSDSEYYNPYMAMDLPELMAIEIS